ncbi:unnamed protein product [Rotaria sordida]|uniref:Uncharacterized protein n=2 Tax=Rotaria sordida TaxID=392033 RepID=A0A814HUQ1_9BILA|nr:unnamed protein product [Rotaria sordida]CAF0929499.1 unnamed protein product [Rotaria sordida]CAF0948779.1 unnamed protein product [Rotaria sordida]CAF0950224.1 unnamed protein product [Rotaria sordida]CAF1014385.1 unnamed protein product [Rotaria sordida]
MLSSYLDIPPPPERPLRFKTKEQIEHYLKAVKDYYDAFKIKLVRRQDAFNDVYSNMDKSINDEELNDQYYLLEKLSNTYKQNQPSRNLLRGRPRKSVF